MSISVQEALKENKEECNPGVLIVPYESFKRGSFVKFETNVKDVKSRVYNVNSFRFPKLLTRIYSFR